MADPTAGELFSLKEWMAAISAKLDRLETKLDGKADLLQVRDVEVRLSILEKQTVESQAEAKYLLPQHARLVEDVDSLKTQMNSSTSVDIYRRWVLGVGVVAFINTIALVVKIVVGH